MSVGIIRQYRITGIGGVALGVTFVAFAIIVPLLGTGPGDQDLANRLAAPSMESPMGTDQLGRDLFSRVAYGARNSLATALSVVVISGIGGGLIGLLSGFIGGKADLAIQRLIDAVMALPLLVLVLAVVATAGASFWSVALAISIAFLPLSARVSRSSTLTLRNTDFIAASRMSGASIPRLIFRHLVPNVAGPWAIVAASQAGAAVLIEAALAFIGAVPGRVTLGSLLGSDAQTYMYNASWLIIWPGVVLGLFSLTANLLGEWISDRLSMLHSG